MDKYIAKCPRCKKKYKSVNTHRKLCPKCKKTKLLKYHKICAYCKEKFKTDNKDVMYCSNKCRNKAKIKIVKIICKNCGKEKEFNSSEIKKFCSRHCYKAYFSNKKNKKVENRERIVLSNKTYKKIKFIFNKRCFLCKNKTDGISNILVIHHIDQKPFNNRNNNLCLLCNRCHSLVHRNKEADLILKLLINEFHKSYNYKVRLFLSKFLI